MKKSLLCTLLLGLVAFSGFSQADRFWSANSANRSQMATDKAVARQSYPKIFKLFNLNFDAFKNEAMSIVDGKSAKKSTTISLPNADGQIEQFEIFEASNMEPALQAKFPEIRAYSGRGITDRYATLKLSVSPQGIQTMVFRTEKDNEFMEPYSADHKVYSVFRSQRQRGALPWNCSTEDKAVVTGLGKKINQLHLTNRSGGNLKTMRLAQSVTAEYSNYFGATSVADSALVLAGINATLTRCNGVYEKDLALHLNLIANTSAVIYYNASTDPYDDASSGAGGTWNGQLQATLTSVIGDANYDIGHLFGASGGGGNAGCIGCVCGSGKGSGFTSPADNIPAGDNFDIDYVVHEVGHQLGGNHTFSMSNEGAGVNVEPGSGITIMGYAGITNYNLAAHSIDIYHAATIEQIQDNLGTISCPVTATITNATPVVAPVGNYTIPKSTPFALTGSATDADNDPLTYCWEQNDDGAGQINANSTARANKPTGPNWVSFPPTISPTRLFPRLASILTGAVTTGPLAGGTAGIYTEALSSVSRPLHFRLTVRDNHPTSLTAPVNVGQTQYTDMMVTVDAGSGPFTVTSPNTAITWTAGTCQTITWDVANTNAAPINCATVNVELSDDGGQTFPYMLASNVPNNGSAQVSLPQSVNSTQARVRVSSVGNIFFDIDNANFSVVAASYPQYAMCKPGATEACENTSANVVINTTSLSGFTSPITFSATGNPAGSTVTFSPNPVTPGNPVTATLGGAFVSGNYTIAITGVADTVTRTVNAEFHVVAAAAVPSLVNPPDLATGVSTMPTYTWLTSPNATSYTLEISTNASFTPVLHTYTGLTGGSFTTPAADALSEDTEYWWRLTASNACGTGPTAPGNHFKTYLTTCNPPLVSTDVPKTIPTTVATVYSTINIPTSGNIIDVDVVNLQGTHTYISDLGIQLVHGTGTALKASKLLDYACNDEQNFDLNYDDEATTAVVPCPPTGGVTLQPATPLSVFDGTDMTGTWTLRIRDSFNQDGGALNLWALRICTAAATTIPVNWLTFTGRANENKTVLLQWSTANEMNNHHYEIERSIDGIRFANLGNIKAGNMPNAVQNYFFNDMKPYSGINYYRLKQVDKDNKFEYSKVVRVVIDKSPATFAVYPNPAHDKSTVRVLADMKDLKLRLTDGLGKIVYTKAINGAKTGQEFVIPVSDLSRGVYVLTVSTENGTSNEKIVVE